MDKNNVSKNNSGIESYEGSDAYYEGTDKDYEDFLKKVDDGAVSSKTSGVENGDDGFPGETINIKGVIDMVRKKAGIGWNTAKKLGGEVRGQISEYIAAANERTEERRAEAARAADEPDKAPVKPAFETGSAILSDAGNDDAPREAAASVSSTAKAAKSHIKSASDAAKEKLSEVSEKLGEVSSIGKDIDKISSDIEAAVSKLDAVSSKLNEIEAKQIENKNNYDRSVNDIRVSMSGLMSEVSEMSQSTGGIAKLSDAVFDLKNAQQSTKKAVTDLEGRLISLRKKITAGVAILSVLSVIMIVLEIINMLS